MDEESLSHRVKQINLLQQDNPSLQAAQNPCILKELFWFAPNSEQRGIILVDRLKHDNENTGWKYR